MVAVGQWGEGSSLGSAFSSAWEGTKTLANQAWSGVTNTFERTVNLVAGNGWHNKAEYEALKLAQLSGGWEASRALVTGDLSSPGLEGDLRFNFGMGGEAQMGQALLAQMRQNGGGTQAILQKFILNSGGEAIKDLQALGVKVSYDKKTKQLVIDQNQSDDLKKLAAELNLAMKTWDGNVANGMASENTRLYNQTWSAKFSQIHETSSGARIPYGNQFVGDQYGWRDLDSDPATGKDGKEDFHYGTDFRVGAGKSIPALASGRVIELELNHKTYGKTILIDRGNGLYSRIAHASELAVRQNDSVTTNQVLGLTGSTGGKSLGPHLHLMLYTKDEKNNLKAVDVLKVDWRKYGRPR